MSKIEILDKMVKDKVDIVFDTQCIRKKTNWSSVSKFHKIDSGVFDPEIFLKDITSRSPKVNSLLEKIDYLDKKDKAKYGKTFKHFVFSDVKSGGHGAKMLAAALLSKGYNLGYESQIEGEDSRYDFPILNIAPLGQNKGGSRDIDTDSDIETDDEEDNKIKWTPIELLEKEQLLETRGNNFYLLSSVSVYGKPISVKMKKEMLSNFNSRPENIHGDLCRIIIMDSGFKEGIDLFDVKYVHIFEPPVNAADQKQIIGRATRTCGQKGLEFDDKTGWPLNVFIYDLEIPQQLRPSLLNSMNTFDLLMKSMNEDMRMTNFGYDIERLSVFGSVDYDLTKHIHNFAITPDDNEEDTQTIYGGRHLKYGEERVIDPNKMTFLKMKDYIREHFSKFEWEPVKMQNMCVDPRGHSGRPKKLIDYTPSQDFIRHYFTPTGPVKGMLLHHSVGTGKTCSAIACATRNFEPEEYTILWVTRTTLKNDIWKNMFQQICNENIRNKLLEGEEIPDDPKKQMRMLSKSWQIRPMSYKQFSNLVSKENDFYRRLVERNGLEDPLRKTLLIIDEAHKLYGGDDLSSIERPDMVALHKSLMNSYAVSGADSVRLLLMTATPITESPMELVQLVNLCKPFEHQMPHSFDAFSGKYLDKEGFFSEKGEVRFLDDIAGHVSYLNREKDARQFAQAIIKRVNVPLATEAQFEVMRQYDAYYMRTHNNETLEELKTKVKTQNEYIQTKLSELDKERFSYLKLKCSQFSPKDAKCQTIIRKHVSVLIKDINTYVKELKTDMKGLQKELKGIQELRTKGLEKIKKNVEKYPERFAEYKRSTYFVLRSICGKRIRSNKEMDKFMEIHPEIIKLDTEIGEHEEYIEMLKNKLVLFEDTFKTNMKRLRSLLSDDLSDLEKMSVKRTINEKKDSHRKTKKNMVKEIDESLENEREELDELYMDKKDIFKRIKQTLKKRLKIEKQQEKKEKQQEKALRKTLRKQNALKKDIEDEVIDKMVIEVEKMIDDELLELEESIKQKQAKEQEVKQEKEKEKIRKKQEKEKEKQEKEKEKQEKEKVKQEKIRKVKQEKEKEKQEKEKVKQEKEKDKQEKIRKVKQEKEKEKQEKEREKTRKKQEKEKKKQDKKRKTEKIREKK
jgi:hypothetical protein